MSLTGCSVTLFHPPLFAWHVVPTINHSVTRLLCPVAPLIRRSALSIVCSVAVAPMHALLFALLPDLLFTLLLGYSSARSVTLSLARFVAHYVA
jgi:hypothetical protein